MRVRMIALTLSAVACSSPPHAKERDRVPESSDVAKPESKLDPKPDPKPDPKLDPKQRGKIDPCSPQVLGLGEARPVKPWAAPAECAAKSGPGPTTIRSEGEFRERFTCPRGTSSGIDFTRQQLVVDDRTLSPASAGTTIVDDGLRVTFIERSRTPCDGDPQPMPIPYTLAFLQPTGASRSYGDASCTLPRTCG